MNINDVAKAWKNNPTPPNWDSYESTQVTVAMAKRMATTNLNSYDRGNENGMGRHDTDVDTNTIYGVTHAG